jgi:hypothetical protein
VALEDLARGVELPGALVVGGEVARGAARAARVGVAGGVVVLGGAVEPADGLGPGAASVELAQAHLDLVAWERVGDGDEAAVREARPTLQPEAQPLDRGGPELARVGRRGAGRGRVGVERIRGGEGRCFT